MQHNKPNQPRKQTNLIQPTSTEALGQTEGNNQKIKDRT